jgi:YD repeat-containing protein
MDKHGHGDTEDWPGVRFEYDLLGFANSSPEDRQPISVRSIRRIHHTNEEDVLPGEADETIETIAYSDAFGRLLQTRTQAEDLTFGDPTFGYAVLPVDQADSQGTKADVLGKQRAPGDPSNANVVVSGWQTYNNKGWVVEKYEPLFATGCDYVSREEAAGLQQQGTNLFGRKATMCYDPRGHLVRTVNTDGSEQHVIYGSPKVLDKPEDFTPTPWETYTYDANDNAGRTHPADSAAYQHHWHTPASLVVDALGRTASRVLRYLYLGRCLYLGGRA